MMRNGYLGKSIGDAAWRQFTTYIESKAAEAGSIVVMVDPTDTTHACSGCGGAEKKKGGETSHDVNPGPAVCGPIFRCS